MVLVLCKVFILLMGIVALILGIRYNKKGHSPDIGKGVGPAMGDGILDTIIINVFLLVMNKTPWYVWKVFFILVGLGLSFLGFIELA
ncbi:hypothetical protein [Priestia koreensis]|uniref:Uncharacterized protein n=1 Tax=Priestia koreensis TaxID=284581 RepID=A0A0M0LCJ1_9BACI|nr:hypothetical protein [Priestia koreensis]KOO48577.1 hypothetical protein AMD01_04110 [Priestia koreensis]